MAAPKGNQNAANGHMMKKALLDAIAIESGHAEERQTIARYAKMIDMWRNVVRKALNEGDEQMMNAVLAIADRLDGKPRQAVEHTGEDGGAIRTESTWVVQPVKPVNEADAES